MQVIVPNNGDSKYIVYPGDGKPKIINDIISDPPDQFITVADPDSSILISSMYKHSDIFLVSKLTMERFKSSLPALYKAVNSEHISPLRVSNKVVAVFNGFLRISDHPVAQLMSVFNNVNIHYVHRTMVELVDPRLFMDEDQKLMNRKTILRMASFMGATKNIFKIITAHKPHGGDKRTMRAGVLLRCWYSSKVCSEIVKTLPMKSMIYPSETPTDLLQSPADYFWRYWHNRIVIGDNATEAQYLTTKRFYELLFRLWGLWVGVYNFEPPRAFKRQCEQKWFAEEYDKWVRQQYEFLVKS